ncbi:hypothetical protein NCCP1664_10730 [Zafaria cholistanensis]|uniref:Uncharacterized protein n=1 Tax=Zafaria cholistanensis TaxID=1682741 RepID=A0A5A7NPU6_9MICC|nr:hypothetical protein NCCP1664_10730 [Zafaria cholistanensis]
MSGMAHRVVRGSDEMLPPAAATDAPAPTAAGAARARVEAAAGAATRQEAARTAAASVVDQILASGTGFEAISYPPMGVRGRPCLQATAPHYNNYPNSHTCHMNSERVHGCCRVGLRTAPGIHWARAPHPTGRVSKSGAGPALPGRGGSGAGVLPEAENGGDTRGIANRRVRGNGKPAGPEGSGGFSAPVGRPGLEPGTKGL